MKVIKRDGRAVDYDKSKIAIAMSHPQRGRIRYQRLAFFSISASVKGVANEGIRITGPLSISPQPIETQ